MSRRVSVLTWCVVIVAAISALVSVGAFAAMVLPVFSGTTTRFIGEGNVALFTLEGGRRHECTRSSDDFSFATGSRNGGPGLIDLEECEFEDELCRSLGASLGSIEATGEWHLVLLTKSSVDSHYFLFALSPTGLHVECPGTALGLQLLEGGILGSINQKSGSTSEFSLGIKDHEGRSQEFTEYENNAGTSVKVSLTVAFGGGKPHSIFLESESNTLRFGSNTSIEK
jgi:hypothetical protein